ncbi:DUF3987 domain-containing protein [Halomonas campisalis]|uniref:DUF3987 domain-containing protein n=1 Tax=Billgrantia campisalis TaxID=74661 RepID=A0ABS9PDK4_9GAMM|nr:YfjI family protein [Halomonas campisalis]MCG6659838.1 DUF3987 domain-containing protein [Halomonas campisalis]MDR5865050.1 YfjI family protein [Halomonas campisalis]
MAIHTGKEKNVKSSGALNEIAEAEKAARGKALHRTADSWPRYHEHSLFYSAALEIQHEFQVPIEMAMMTALGAIACVCQGLIDVELPTGQKVNPALMLLTIAKSGERKTTVQKNLFSAITAHNRKALQEGEAAQEEYQRALYIWKAELKTREQAWRQCIKKGKEEEANKLHQSILSHQRREPRKPRGQRILYTDTTPQALVQAMHNNAPFACILTSEANSIFSGHALKDLDKINTLWDGDDIIVDRTTRPSFILSDHRLTLSIMAQPLVIERFLSKRGEEARGIGFLARFITVKASEKAGTRHHRVIGDLPHTQRFNARIQTLLDDCFQDEAPATSTEGEGESPATLLYPERNVLTFSVKAKIQWEVYQKEIERLQSPNQALHYYTDHASKLMENISRMAALLHHFEGKEGDIEVSTLCFAHDFCRKASQHFQKHLAGTPTVVKDANDIVECLFLAYEKEKDKRKEESPKTEEQPTKTPGNDRSPYTSFDRHAPQLGVRGRRHFFKLSLLKQFGPYALRGRANHSRLLAALDFLQRMGHVKQHHHDWEICESLYSGPEGPAIRNGIDFTVDNLPLFEEQVYWESHPGTPRQYDHWQIKDK